MSDADAVDPTVLARRVDEQRTALTGLIAEVEELRRSLSTELRTRRIAVVEDDGFERVVVDADGRSGLVTVHARTLSREPTCVELIADDSADDGLAGVAVALTSRGEVAGSLDLVEGREPSLFLGDFDQDP